jgi:hypothetical protein
MSAAAVSATPTLSTDRSPDSGAASVLDRAAARTTGITLAVMAVAAPLGLLVALPAGATGIAALTVLVVAALDVVVGVALFVVLRPAGRLLAGCAAALRLAYAAAFASAAGWLLGDADVARFEAAWDAALLAFGAHLVLVGVTVVRAAGMPSWVGALTALAGVGYLVDSVSVALEAPLSVSEFSFVGEVVLLGWLLVRGLRRGSR